MSITGEGQQHDHFINQGAHIYDTHTTNGYGEEDDAECRYQEEHASDDVELLDHDRRRLIFCSKKGGIHKVVQSVAGRLLLTGLIVVAFAYLLLKVSVNREDEWSYIPTGGGGASTAEITTTSLSRYNSTVLEQRANLPPLSSLLLNGCSSKDDNHDTDSIAGNVEWLLDFSIIGFPKSGTSSLKRWLNASSSMYLDGYEVNGLSNHKPNRVVKHLYQVVSTLQAPNIKIGIKNPTDLESSLQYYHSYFPNTQLIVLLRHPVHWFQSYYNFRVRKYNRLNNNNNRTRRKIMPPVQHLIGKCHTQNDGVCTDRAQFHLAIRRLGLTPMNTTRELALFQTNATTRDNNITSLRATTSTNQRVLFVETNQMTTGNTVLQHDLKRFLGVDDLPPMPPHEKSDVATGYTNNGALAEIDICHVNYTRVRKILVEHGQTASQWILEYLLSSTDAVVSSRPQFIHHIQAWRTDPCLE